MSVAGLLLMSLGRGSSLAALLLNISAIQLFALGSIFVHELGHACAGRLVGLRIFGIEIGQGKIVYEFAVNGFWCRFRTVMFAGSALGAVRDTRWYRLRQSVFILGGPLANGLLLLAAFAALDAEDNLRATRFAGFAPATVLLLTNAGLLAFSLWPASVKTDAGKMPNDGRLLWMVWRLPRAEIEQAPAFYYYYEAEGCRQQRDYEAAQHWLEEGLRRFPTHYYLEYLSGNNFLDLGRARDALQIHVRQLGRYHAVEEMRVGQFNNIAYAAVLTGEPELLSYADLGSRQALEKIPWNPWFKGTRGAVLVELGNYEEALNLLHQALIQHVEKSDRAQIACWIAMAHARSGNIEASKTFFTLARQFDSKCSLLGRELKEHSAIKPH